MRSNFRSLNNRAKSVLRGTTLLAGIGAAFMAVAPAYAADADADNSPVETVVVTGYRASLTAATDAKRASTNFTDSIFAEDIGKFPDTNIAESLNRIPGVTISREIDGEGLNVSIRGLGTNFTKITLNNAQVAVASTGATDQRNNNREVDLNMFPTELFTQLTVTKSPTADLIEGGAAGNVNMRSDRPFDKEGFRFTYTLGGSDNSESGSPGERGALIVSDTWGSEFGVLVGVAGVHSNVFVKGWEDGNAGWVGPSEQANQCTAASGCANFGSKSWPIQSSIPVSSTPGVPALLVPVPAGYTLTGGATPYSSGGTNYFPAGYTVQQADLLALNPGLTAQQISNALLPRLGRDMFEEGSRDRFNGIASLEWRPMDGMHFYADFIMGRTFNNLNRSDIDWGVRSGVGSQNMIPANLKLAPDWLNYTGNQGGAVTSGTFYGAGFFLEARPYKEKGDYFSINPGMEWQINDLLNVDLQLDASRSHFFRDSPTILVTTCSNTPLAAGIPNCTPPTGGAVVQFNNTGAFPTETSSLNLNDPNSYIWNNGRVNLQDEKRYTYTNGAHFDVKWGGDTISVKAGGAYDEIFRSITAIDDSQRWQNAICGDNPNVYLPTPNAGNGVGCNGQNTPTPVGAANPATVWPGYGTGYSTGFPPETFGGSLIPTSALNQYLIAGPTGFVTVNYAKLLQASNYYPIDNAAINAVSGCSTSNCTATSPPFSTSSATGGTSGSFDEKDYGAYIMADGTLHFGDRDLKWDAGLRWAETHQTIISPVQHTDPRNATLANGGFYPNYFTFSGAKHDYAAFLPDINIVYNVADDFLVRASASRTMTRPDPSVMISVVNFSDVTAQSATVGNPALKPFFSNNIDLGAEYYTGGEGYFSVAVFRKSLSGFTVQSNVTEPFSYLDQFGIDYINLTATQQTAICNRTAGCNPATATQATIANTTITVTEQVNSPGLKIINGIELGYVQPLDFLLEQYGWKGFGFTGNLTIVDQKSTANPPTIATGVAPFTYNVTGYYDNDGISARLSYVFSDTSYASGSNQQSVCLPTGTSAGGCPGGAYLFSKAYGQADFSSSLKLSKIFTDELPSDPELTFDVQNIFSAKQVTYDQFPDAVHSYYIKGQTFLFGIRGTF